MSKDDQRDFERYEKHIEDIERSIDILKGEEPRAIKRLMLQQLNTDALTYGDVLELNDMPYFIKQSADVKHIWSLESELKSFRCAIGQLKAKEERWKE